MAPRSTQHFSFPCFQNQDKKFENFESNFFFFESVLSSDNTDPDKNFFNNKLQQIDSPYFSVDNFIAISEQLNKDHFSILHLSIRSLNANIDNFREFLASLNGNFSVIVLTESCCDETTIENSLLNLNNYFSVHQTRKNKKGGGIFIYIHKHLEFKLRNDIDIFNNEIETRSVEIINSKSRNFVVTGICRPPKVDIKVFKNYCKDFLKKENASSKIFFMVGDLNINSFNYDNNELVKKFFNLIFQSEFLPVIQRATRVTRTTAAAIDHIITDAILESTIHSGIIKANKSDHFLIFTILENSCNKNKNYRKTKITKRDFSNENIQSFKFLLENIKWDQFLPSNTPSEAYNIFKRYFLIYTMLLFQKKKLKLKAST